MGRDPGMYGVRATDRVEFGDPHPARTVRVSRAAASRVHPAAKAVLVAIACFIGAEFDTAARFQQIGTAVLFPPYAILAAALLLSPPREWWLYLLASSLGNFWPHHAAGAPTSFVVLAELANYTRALVAAAGVRRFGGRPVHLQTLRGVWVFLLFAVVLGPLAAAFAGASVVALYGGAGHFWLAWQAWLLSNMLTALTLLPMILIGIGNRRTRWMRGAIYPARVVEGAAVLLGLVTFGGYALLGGSDGAPSLPERLYGPLPFLVWAAVRFGPGGTSASLLTMAVLAIVGATVGHGPFVTHSVLHVQLFLFAISVPLLLLAALTAERQQTAAILRAGRERYRSIVEDQTEMISRFLPDGTYTFVNGAVCRMFRRSAEEIVGHRFWDFLPAEDHEATRQYLDSITVDRPVASREHAMPARPGRDAVWTHWTTRGFFDDHGAVIEYQAVGRDITEFKRAETAARESETQLRSFVEHSPAAVAMFDRDMNYVIHSRRWLQDYKLGDRSLVGRSHYEVFPEIPDRWKEVHRRCLAGAVEACEEEPFPRHDGSIDWVRWELRPWRDVLGEIGGVILLTELITARKRAEEEHRQLEAQRQIEAVLRASEERFRSLADNAPVLIWMSGLRRGEGVYFNKPWLEFTGRSLDEELGVGWMESIHPDDRQRCADTCDRAFARREPWTRQLRLRRHDGEYRWVLDSAVPYFGSDGGTFSGYVGSCVDITARKLAEEELQEAGRRKDEFLAMLGHELRNPLAPIGMAVELLRDVAQADESIAWSRDVITRQLRQLTHLVDDLLDVSRITRGKITLRSAAVELTSVVVQAVETIRPLIDNAGHQLTTQLPSDPVWVRGDAARLGQVLSNLLNNAAKYTPDGGRIGLSVEARDSQAILRVTDNGVGLSDKMLERVFDLFWQFDARDHAQRGLGIGLTLVRRLVELHGGNVEARSAGRGKGSEFIVRLPAMEVPAEPPTVATVRATRAPLPRRRILVVDDNVDAAEALSRILRLEDQEVFVAHDGHAALRMAGAMDPEIVFLDLALPKMHGLDVAQRLRAGSPERLRLLVATTGFGQEEDRRRTREAGFDQHLVKPIDSEVLRSLLASVE